MQRGYDHPWDSRWPDKSSRYADPRVYGPRTRGVAPTPFRHSDKLLNTFLIHRSRASFERGAGLSAGKPYNQTPINLVLVAENTEVGRWPRYLKGNGRYIVWNNTLVGLDYPRTIF